MSKPLKVLILNGSPHADGNIALAIKELESVFHESGVETEVVQVGKMNMRGCVACGLCRKTGICAITDDLGDIADSFEQADGLIAASPVYFAGANSSLTACMTRLFYSTTFDKSMKVGASVVCARRGGCSATFDELNKFFTISGMPIASSQYWNSLHGAAPGEAQGDAEGLQTMRTLARNMTFLMKSIALGKESFGLPEREPFSPTNFIR